MVVSKKWPKWLVASWSSKPSLVLSSGQAMTPACCRSVPVHHLATFSTKNLLRRRHELTCIVDQHIQGPPSIQRLPGKAPDAVQVRQVHLHCLHPGTWLAGPTHPCMQHITTCYKWVQQRGQHLSRQWVKCLLDLVPGRPRLVDVPACHHRGIALRGQRLGCLKADAGVGTCACQTDLAASAWARTQQVLEHCALIPVISTLLPADASAARLLHLLERSSLDLLHEAGNASDDVNLRRCRLLQKCPVNAGIPRDAQVDCRK